MSERTLRVFWAEGVPLESLEAALRDGRLYWFYGERMEDLHLDWLPELLDGKMVTSLDRVEAGRGFGPDLEVDWWRGAEGYRLRALLEEGKPPAGVDWREADGPPLESLPEQGDEHPLILWGTYDEDHRQLGVWTEARIPRPLPHPTRWEGSAPPERVVLLVQDYRQDGAVVLTRFLKVEPERGG